MLRHVSIQNEKRDRAQEFKRSQDREFMDNIDSKLLSISSKLQSAKNNHDELLAEKRAETSKENTHLIQKVQ